jgi:mono/diheme cytochrome c family protein
MTSRVRRYALRILVAVVAIAGAAVAGVWGVAHWRLSAQHDAALVPLKVQPSADLVAEGERVFHIFGCAGCHQEAGNVLFEAPNVGRLIAPNISRRLADYSDDQLVRLIRRGVKHDGTTAIVMPASVLGRISDQDLAALVSLSQKPIADDPMRWRSARNGDRSATSRLRRGRWTSPRTSRRRTKRRSRGRSRREGDYLVSATCRACHDLDSVHDNGFGMVTPPVRAMAKSYSLEDFRHLLRTGEGSGGRQLGLMSEVARSDYSHFTDGEIDAIHQYLNAPRD